MNISRESIFVSSIRSICVAFFSVIGVLIGLIVLVAISSMFIGPKFSSSKSHIQLAPDANWERAPLPVTAPVILKINIHGIIGTRGLQSSDIENVLLSSRETLFQNDRVKGILLDIMTPGGTAIDSDNIYTLLKEYKKRYNVPVYAYIDGMCASGGMYIAAAADKILSKNTGMIGSIGVRFGPLLNYTGLMEKYGVGALTLTQGKYKDMLNSTKPFDPTKYASLETVMQSDYNRFVEVIVTNRKKINKSKLINEYGAQIYDPADSLKMGYIDDANSNYFMALQELVTAAKIDADTKYQVVTIVPPKPLLENLLENSMFFSKKVTHKLQFPGELEPELTNKVLYYYTPDENTLRS